MRIKSFVTAGIMAVAAPLLLAPDHAGCSNRCVIQRLANETTSDTFVVEGSSWAEVDLKGSGYYYVQIKVLEGEAELSVAPLMSDSSVSSFYCSSAEGFTRCQFRVTSKGRVGISVIPSDYSAEVTLSSGPANNAL